MKTTFFKNDTYKSNILKKYDLKRNNLKKTYASEYIFTTYGKTHILKGNDSKLPHLVLVHGIGSSSPYILDKFSFLATTYNLIAIDILGHPNKSEEIRLSKKNNDYGLWLSEVLLKLQLPSYSILGWSFGAFVVLKMALLKPQYLNNIILLSPAGLVNGNFYLLFKKQLAPLLLFKITKLEKHLEKSLEAIQNEVFKEDINTLQMIILGYRLDFSHTPIFNNKELQSITHPLCIISGEQDLLFPEHLLSKRKNIFTNFTGFLTLKLEKHIFSKQSENTIKLFLKQLSLQ